MAEAPIRVLYHPLTKGDRFRRRINHLVRALALLFMGITVIAVPAVSLFTHHFSVPIGMYFGADVCLFTLAVAASTLALRLSFQDFVEATFEGVEKADRLRRLASTTTISASISAAGGIVAAAILVTLLFRSL